MRPQYSIVSQPISEPITYAQAADHLRVDSQADVNYITDLIPVAREYVDGLTGRVSAATTHKLTADSWQSLFEGPSPLGADFNDPIYGVMPRNGNQQVIPLWRTPLVSVSSVKYYANGDTVLTTMDTADYIVVTGSEPGRIQILDGLPALDDRIDAVQITFIAGNATPNAVHRHAIKLMVAHLYETRTPIAFASAVEIPHTLKDLITNQKTGGFF